MEIEQVKRARREMEAIDTFNTKTGMPPEHIDLRMVDTTTLGDHDRPFIIGVHAEVTI